MRPLLATIAIIYLVFPKLSHAEEAIINCTSPTGQVEINECIKERYGNTSRHMHELYDSKLLSLTKESRQRLRFSQEAWLTFRERTCVYQSQGIDGGQGWQMMYLSCMTSMTEKRISDLQEYIACTENGCPN